MSLSSPEPTFARRIQSAVKWLERWIRTEKGAVAARTMMRYEQIVRDF